jgi:hypothetical protein
MTPFPGAKDQNRPDVRRLQPEKGQGLLFIPSKYTNVGEASHHSKTKRQNKNKTNMFKEDRAPGGT